MLRVEESLMETVHLYVVREKEKQPFSFLPLFAAFLCLVALVGVTVYSGYHPSYEHERLTIPAQFLPLKNFTVSTLIIPTGSKTYPATKASGILTVTNGSDISQELPAGIILTGNAGIEIVTDTSVFIPAGSANGYGFATVSAHAMRGGASGNIPAYAIDRVEGSSIYIRNLSAFHDGENAYSVAVITPQDRQTAIDLARVSLATQKGHTQAILAKPCSEIVNTQRAIVTLIVKWTCQFVRYPSLPEMKVTSIRLVGKNLFVDVESVARPRKIWVK